MIVIRQGSQEFYFPLRQQIWHETLRENIDGIISHLSLSKSNLSVEIPYALLGSLDETLGDLL